MVTKKRTKGKPASSRKSTPRKAKRAPKAAARAAKKAAPRRAAKKASARPAARRAPKPAAGAASAARELTAVKARFQREKSALEKRLTETVREIGQLRHHEARATQLERQVKERDETIGQLRTQLGELRNREIVRHDDDAQPSLALGSRTRDLDEFDEEDVEPEEDDELI